MDLRKPAVAGKFYPEERKALREKIKECFKNEMGPGNLPDKGSGGGFRAGIVPHAGYEFSGSCAAHVFGKLVETGFPDHIVIFGSSHHTDKDVVFDDRDYITPFGKVSNSYEKLDKTVGELDKESMDKEHSIEVQLPFLQFFNKDFSFLPVAVSTFDIKKLGLLAEQIRNSLNGDVYFLASTDFTHCGLRFGQVPPKGQNPGDFAESQDMEAVRKIKQGDAENFLETVRKENISMCGAPGVASMLKCVENQVLEVDLKSYYSSYDLVGGSDAVGYAGIVLREV